MRKGLRERPFFVAVLPAPGWDNCPHPPPAALGYPGLPSAAASIRSSSGDTSSCSS
jgi:hypothetical protein